MLALALVLSAAATSHALSPDAFERGLHVTASADGLTIRLDLQPGDAALLAELRRRLGDDAPVADATGAAPVGALDLLRAAVARTLAEEVMVLIDGQVVAAQLFDSEVRRRHHPTASWTLHVQHPVAGSGSRVRIEDRSFPGRPQARLRRSLSARPEVAVVEGPVEATPVRAEPLPLAEASVDRAVGPKSDPESAASDAAVGAAPVPLDLATRTLEFEYRLSDRQARLAPPPPEVEARWLIFDHEAIWLSMLGLLGLALLWASRTGGHDPRAEDPSE